MSGIAPNPLNDISKVYLNQIAEKKDDSYLETDMKKRQKNNEKAIADMKKVKDDTVPRWMKESELEEVTKMGVHAPHEVPSKNLKGMVKKAVKRIDADNDGDVDKDDPKEKGMGEFVPSPDGKKKIRTKVSESPDYDPMDDDEFDHDEAEENRGVSGKNNPKGGKSLGKKKIRTKVSESHSNWRQDLAEVMTDDIDSKPIKEKKVNNKIKINPKLGEAIEAIGGTLIEMVEVEEGIGMTMAKAVGNPPALSKRMKLKQALLNREIKKNAAENKKKSYSGKAAKIGEGFVDPEEGEAPSGRRPLDNVIDHPNKNVRKKAIKGMKKQMAKEYGGKWSSKSDDPNESYELEGQMVDENVATGKARRAKFGGISQKVGKSEVVTNKEKSAALEKHFAAKKAKEKSAGEAAHKAASAKGLSPAEAEMRRKAAERKAARMRKEEVEIDEKYKGSDHRPPAGWKSYGGYEKEKPEVNATAKRIDAIRKSIKVKEVNEKLNLKKADMGDVIKDFYKSDAPQFKGRSKEKRREMAIAAKLTAERGGKRLGEGATEAPMSQQELALQKRKTMIDQMIAKKRQQALQKTKNQEQA